MRDVGGQLAVAWVHAVSGVSWEVRFLRATGDPAVLANWKNATGSSTSPDSLGIQSGVFYGAGSMSLARMPSGAPSNANDDALYLFWGEDATDDLWWSRAQVSGVNYTSWTTPVAKDTNIYWDGDTANGWTSSGVATAVDSRNRGILVGVRTASDRSLVFRKHGLDDSNGADLTLADGSTTLLGPQLSLGVDRGDIYGFYIAGGVSYRRYHPETGWSAASAVEGSSWLRYPSVRRELSDGQADVVYTNWVLGTGRHARFAVSRPFITNVLASPTSFNPSAAQSTTISYTLADNLSSSLTTTVRVYNGSGGLVRTLVNGSQAVGTQNVVWDGKNDSAVIVANGTYTVKVNATDGESLAAPEQTVTVTVTGGAAAGPVTYQYDALNRLTSAAYNTGTNTYAYNAVGNRTSLTTSGGTTNYTYDAGDRMTQAGATTYTYDANGNLTARGADTFTWDSANRLTGATVSGTSATMGYDGSHQMVAKTVGAAPTRYCMIGIWRKRRC